MSTRYERMLEAISKGERITEEPICRREMFLKALANNEGVSNLPEPICREEEFYRSIIKGEKITVEPICKKEEYLKAIANNEPLPESSRSSCMEEKLFRNVCTSGNVGGGGSTPSEPTTYTITFGAGVTVLNGSTSITSGTKVTSGTSLKVSYTLSEHYHLVSFKVNGTEVANNSTITVTSNVTITFTQEIDTYSVIFNDGVSVLNGETSLTSGDKVSYGTSLVVSYTLTDGYKLTSFQVNGVDTENNATITITENIEIVFAEEEEASSGGGDIGEFSRTFSENSPAMISQIGNEISANKMTSAQVKETYGWNIGDTKDITLTTGEVIQMRIIGFNHDTLSDGSGTAGITLEMVNCLNTLGAMTTLYWSTSDLRITTLKNIKDTLPTIWQSIIKTINKVTDGQSTDDDLFLLSTDETGAFDNWTNSYEYWVNNTNRIKLCNGSAQSWWLRTAGYESFWAFSETGTRTSYSRGTNHGISFAFCVGGGSSSGGGTGGDTPTFSTTFGENTPEQIAQVSALISANNMTSAEVEANFGWKIGDTTSYQLTTGENVEMRIIGFNHDDKSDGSGKAGITLETCNILTTQAYSDGNVAYNNSNINKSYFPNLKTILPTDLLSVIKTVNKKYAKQWGSTTVNTLSTELFLLSSDEVATGGTGASWESKVAAFGLEGLLYEYYNGLSDAGRVKYLGTTKKDWWLRSLSSDSNMKSAYVGSSGSLWTNSVSQKYGVSFAFCI